MYNGRMTPVTKLSLFVVLSLTLAGCGGRTPSSGYGSDAGRRPVPAFCNGGSPAIQLDNKSLTMGAVQSLPGPPMSCCYSTITELAAQGSGQSLHFRVLVRYQVGTTQPPVDLDLDKLPASWGVTVTYHPCATGGGCKATATLGSTNGRFGGFLRITGNSTYTQTLSLCLHTTPTGAPFSSARLYVPALPIRWF